MLTGYIDYCRGRYIHGWALSRTRAEPCRVTAEDQTGRILAEVLATGAREDLAAMGLGRTNFAFRIGVPFTAAPGPVRVRADGVELPPSPVMMTENTFDAHLSVAGGRVSGWVSSRGAEPITRPITLVDQDSRLVLTLPVQPETPDTDPLYRPAHFSAALPAHCFGRDELCLILKLGGNIIARGFGSCRLEGYLDRLTESACAGWLFSPDAPDRSFDLCVYCDGVLTATARAMIERDDVARRYAGAGACGFELALPPEEHPAAGLRHVSLRLAGSDHELLGGPFLVGSRAQAVQAVHDAMEGLAQGEPVSESARAILTNALADTLHSTRTAASHPRIAARPLPARVATTSRLAVIIPVYTDPAATALCLDSVIRTRRPGSDSIVIVNDNPDDPAIRELVEAQARHPDVFILRNERNIGFVESVNRALRFVRAGDVLLLNADTELFAGGIDEMHRVLHSAPDIGSVTALSNNATLFSYPHPSMTEPILDDIAWAELAAVALRENAGTGVAIPTGHGFCMMIRRATLDEIGLLDTAFARGYGEENDFCIRAADRGWRHLLAGGAFVRHDEAGSFGSAKPAMLERNLALLGARYPEYHERISRFAAADPVRRVRWELDFHRLRRLKIDGRRLELIIENWLDGGMQRAAHDIDSVVRTPNVHALRLVATKDGRISLHLEELRLLALFQHDDAAALFELLATLELERVVVHHLLGFSEDFVRRLGVLIADRAALFHIHDFYYACPRVTMIDASGTFCGGAATDRCARCVGLGGRHPANRMDGLAPAEHRLLFRGLLGAARHLMTPSIDAANWLSSLIPGIQPIAVPHPQTRVVFPIGVRRGSATDICLIGAIGPHKGSATLLELARHSWLNHPELCFHVVGFTNLDAELAAVGNVTITGKYAADELPGLVEATGARVALFLHNWPETFSYTLSEAVGLGLIPVVPDIGAPAERVRSAGFGVIYPYPIDCAHVASQLIAIGNGTMPFSRDGALPRAFETSEAHDRLRALYHGGVADPPAGGRVRRRRTAGQ